MTTCYRHPRCHVQHEGDSCPICVQLSAQKEAIEALGKLREEETKALECLAIDKPNEERTAHA